MYKGGLLNQCISCDWNGLGSWYSCLTRENCPSKSLYWHLKLFLTFKTLLKIQSFFPQCKTKTPVIAAINLLQDHKLHCFCSWSLGNGVSCQTTSCLHFFNWLGKKCPQPPPPSRAGEVPVWAAEMSKVTGRKIRGRKMWRSWSQIHRMSVTQPAGLKQFSLELSASHCWR